MEQDLDQPEMNDEFSSLFLQDLEMGNNQSNTHFLSGLPNLSDEFDLVSQQLDGFNKLTPTSAATFTTPTPSMNGGNSNTDFNNPPNFHWTIPAFSHYSSLIPIEATIQPNNFTSNNLNNLTNNTNFQDQSFSRSHNNNNTYVNHVGSHINHNQISQHSHEQGIHNTNINTETNVNVKIAKNDFSIPLNTIPQQPLLPTLKDEALVNEYTPLLDFEPSLKEGESTSLENKLIDFNDHEVNYDLTGFLNGKFFTNDDVSEKKIISCYRRNYIQVSFSIDFNNQIPYKLYNNDLIAKFKISVFANINLSDEKIEVLIFEDKKTSNNEDGDINYINTKEFEVPVSQIKNINTYIIKKLQFKHATPNNGKLNFQNYYHLIIKFSCVTISNDIIELESIKSKPIVVRGRNPSFYTEKNDILIPNKNSSTANNLNKASNIDKLNKVIQPASPMTPKTTDSIPPEDYVVPQDPVSSDSKSSGGTSSATSYKYFPISSTYYLPPINVVYFPHGAHHPRQSDSVIKRRDEINDGGLKKDEVETGKKTNVRNYYFKS